MSEEIRKLNQRINGTQGFSLFHDTRSDIATLSRVINNQQDKINELIDCINKLSKESCWR